MAKRRTHRFVMIFVFLVAIVYTCVHFNVISSRILDNFSSYVVYPTLVIHSKLVEPIKVWMQQRYTLQELRIKLAAVQEEKEQLLSENIRLNASLSYQEDVQVLHEFKHRYRDENVRTAQVLARQFSLQSHFFLVDVGTNQGIQQDMVVLYKNCLIGKIVEVYPWYSKVCLITDRLCKVAAYCVGSKANGIHEGINEEGRASLQYVSHLAQVNKGDLVISSGEGMVFPQGFALGRIGSMHVDGLFHQISIEPLINLRTIHYCLIMPKSVARADS